jgi:hypothetical protein
VRKRASARLRATQAALTCVFSLCAAWRGLSQPPPHKERQTRHKDIMSYNSEIDAPLLLRGFGRWWLSREMLKRLNSFWPLVPLCDATCGWCMAHSNPKCARQRDIWCTSILSALSVCVYWNLALEFEKQIRMCLSFLSQENVVKVKAFKAIISVNNWAEYLYFWWKHLDMYMNGDFQEFIVLF